MTYRTCIGCVFEKGPCAEREKVRAQVKGLGVTTLKWRCSWRRSRLQPGDPVFAETFAFQPEEGDSEDYLREFPAVIIAIDKPGKPLVFIQSGALSTDDEFEFEPKGNGFCRIPASRIRKRDGVREAICPHCLSRTQIEPHSDFCRNYVAPAGERGSV